MPKIDKTLHIQFKVQEGRDKSRKGSFPNA
jgi:hypothetical protein